jgi:hypothetical protein
MPSIDFNPLAPRFGRVVLRRYGNRMVFSRPPTRNGTLSPAVVRQNLRFREAAAYSKGIFGVPARRAPYEAAAEEQHQPVFATIMAEFAKNPVIRDVKTDGYHGHTGDVIAVLARADLNLATVHVRLRKPDDTVLEEGDAVLASGEYRYTAIHDAPAGADVFADVTVRDTDGLEVKRSVQVTVSG